MQRVDVAYPTLIADALLSNGVILDPVDESVAREAERFFATINQLFLSELPGYTPPGSPKQARKLHADPSNSIMDICRLLGISRATLYRYLSLFKNPEQPR